MQIFEEKLSGKLPRGACERALVCQQATKACKHEPFLTADEMDSLRGGIEKRWMDCYAYKQELGMTFDKDLGVYILKEWKDELMKRVGK